ncbi:MAG: cell division protein ZapA, partial [Bacteroidales bacterium]|nr:cell division protein ZapA [Bacteroidales bacterium]
PLKIDNRDEEKIRKAARLINDKVLQYKQKYSDKDTQDFLAMAALQYVTKVLEYESEKDTSGIEESLKALEEELTEYLRGV